MYKKAAFVLMSFLVLPVFADTIVLTNRAAQGVIIKVEPQVGSIIVKGSAPNASVLQTNENIGILNFDQNQSSEKLTFFMHRRPWKVVLLSFRGETLYHLSSEGQGLRSDILMATDQFEVNVQRQAID